MPISSDRERAIAHPDEVGFTPFDCKSVDAQGTFFGYASLFGQADLSNDVVMRGAFRKSLCERGAAGIKLLFQHDPCEPIGVWEELREDVKGLFARGRLMQEVARAREVLSLMRAGALDGLSIGFRTRKGHTEPKSGVRKLFDIDLWEISVVTFPMHPRARVANVKRAPGTPLPSVMAFERWLVEDVGLTRPEAKVVIHSGYRSLADVQGSVAGTGGEAQLVAAIRRATKCITRSKPGLSQSFQFTTNEGQQ